MYLEPDFDVEGSSECTSTNSTKAEVHTLTESTDRRPTLNRILQNDPEHLGYVKTSVSDRVFVLHDTGASLNVISRKFAEKHYKGKILRRKSPLHVDTGKSQLKIYDHVVETIVHGIYATTTNLYVIPDLPQYDIILGRNTLQALGIHLGTRYRLY